MTRMSCNFLKVPLLILIFFQALSAAAYPPPEGNLTITAAVLDNFPPLYQMDRKGKPVGYAIEILEHIARSAGANVRYITVPNYGELQELLASGRADLAPFLAITEDRKHNLDFTDTINTLPISFFVHSSIADQVPPKVTGRVAVLRGGIGSALIAEHPDISVQVYENIKSALMALLSSDVEAVVALQPAVQCLTVQIGLDDQLTAIGPPLAYAKFAIAMRKGNADLLKTMNGAVTAFAGSSEHHHIYQKWFVTSQEYWTPRMVFWTMFIASVFLLLLVAGWRYLSMSRLNRRLNGLVDALKQSHKDLLAARFEAEQRATEAEEGSSILKALMDYIPEGIAISSAADGMIHTISKHGQRITARSCDELMSKPVGQHAGTWQIHCRDGICPAGPDDLPDYRALYYGEEVINRELIIMQPSGARVPILCNSGPIRDNLDNLIGAITAFRDISAIEAAERSLRENVALQRRLAEEATTQRGQLQAIIDSMVQSVIIFDKDGNLLKMNPAGLRLHGYACMDEVDRELERFCTVIETRDPEGKPIPKDARPVCRALRGELVRDLEIHLYNNRKGNNWIGSYNATPVYNECGQLAFVVVVIDDITQRKVMEEILRTSEERYRLLVENSPDAIIIVRDETVSFANPSALKLIGASGSEFPFGTPALEFFHSDSHSAVRERIDPCNVYTGSRSEEKLVRLDGVAVDVEVAWQQVELEGPAVQLVIRDITDRKCMEAALRQSEELFRSLFEHSRDGIFALNPDGRFFMTNPAAELLSGYSTEEARGLTFLDICTPESRNTAHTAFLNALHTAEPVEIEASIIRKDEHPIDLLVAGSPMLLSGKIEGIFCIARDITEKNRIERALRKSEERLRMALAGAKAGVWSSDLKTGQTVWSLENFELYGLDPTEGSPTFEAWKQFLHPDDRAKAAQTFGDVFSQRTSDYHSEYRIIHPRLGVRWILGVGRLERAEDGTPLQIVGINIDITERKQTEEELRSSEERYRALVNATSNAVWRMSADGKTMLSLIGANIYEHMEPDRYNSGWLESIHPDDRGLTRAAWETAITARSLLEVEHRHLSPDGAYRHFLSRAVPVRDDSGEVLEWIGTSEDITERKEAQVMLQRVNEELELRVRRRTAELEKANAELREVPSRLIAAQEEERKRIGGELHDSIGQTLAALKYWVEMILMIKEKGGYEEAFNKLEQFVPIFQRSIEETRAIYMGLRPTLLETMGIKATLQWFCREFNKLYPQHHIELEMDVEEPEIPESLKIVIFRITQEALNNIAKHSCAEWVDIKLLRRGGSLRLTIEDDGNGFSVEEVLSQTYGRSLGLTGMKERAEIMGGVFSIQSRPGEGTKIAAVW